MTRWTRRCEHERFQFDADRIAVGLVKTALDRRQNAVPLEQRFHGRLCRALRRRLFAGRLACTLHRFGRRAQRIQPVQQRVTHILRQLAPRRAQIKLQRFREPRQNHLAQIAVGLTPRQHHAFEQRQ